MLCVDCYLWLSSWIRAKGDPVHLTAMKKDGSLRVSCCWGKPGCVRVCGICQSASVCRAPRKWVMSDKQDCVASYQFRLASPISGAGALAPTAITEAAVTVSPPPFSHFSCLHVGIRLPGSAQKDRGDGLHLQPSNAGDGSWLPAQHCLDGLLVSWQVTGEWGSWSL